MLPKQCDDFCPALITAVWMFFFRLPAGFSYQHRAINNTDQNRYLPIPKLKANDNQHWVQAFGYLFGMVK